MSTPARRPLGRSGLLVAPFAFGGNVFGWTVDEARAFELLDAFVDAGFNLIDTADVYPRWVTGRVGGESETTIGHWLSESGRRGEVLLATKVGGDMGEGGKGLAPAHIRRSVQDSLDRLGTDHIDLYQAHLDDPTVPLAETLATFSELLENGSVRAIGASNYTAARLTEALEVSAQQGLPRYETLQPRDNLLDRTGFEGAVETVCREQGLGVLTYSSLASGFLTGKYRTPADVAKSPRGSRMVGHLDERGRRILAALDALSARLGVPASTVALAWLIEQPSVTAPIASATSVGQLRELTAAAELHLDADALRDLGTASAP